MLDWPGCPAVVCSSSKWCTDQERLVQQDGDDDFEDDGELTPRGDGGGMTEGKGGEKKPRRRRNRSERQQMLNKLAQQRYRCARPFASISTSGRPLHICFIDL